MSWWVSMVEYLKETENGQATGQFSVKKAVHKALAESVVDFLYYIVGFFTIIYFLAAGYLFFKNSGVHYGVAVRIFSSLSEPYLGLVGIYVILKEIRKGRLRIKSKHFGEFFVYLWLILFLTTLTLVWFSPNYYFDELMGTITSVALVLVVIYAIGIIHKP